MTPAREHLHESEMGYWTHLKHSWKQSNRLLGTALKSYVHGVLPWFFAGDGPRAVYTIYKEIRQMRHIRKTFDDIDNA